MVAIVYTNCSTPYGPIEHLMVTRSMDMTYGHMDPGTSPLVLDVVYVASMVHCVYWYTVVEGRNQIHTNYCTVRIAIECVLVLWIHGYDLPTSGSQDTS